MVKYEVFEIERADGGDVERKVNALCASGGKRVVSVVWLPASDETAEGAYEIWIERTDATA